tara:strand:+ start:8570 stop:10873 length:2304 start_codon:yes stop_codon:yes gene_type:complete
MAKFGFSQSITRVEDDRFLTGKGQFSDDLNLSGQAWGWVLRSPHAHAQIISIDTTKAINSPGVIDIITGSELENAKANHVPTLVPMTNRDGSAAPLPKHPILCIDRVLHVGDSVAFVVAESLEQAKAAAEIIEVEYKPLQSICNTRHACDKGQPLVHQEAQNNLAFEWEFGDEEKNQSIFSKCSHVVSLDLINNRVVVASMEPRGALASYDEELGKLTLHTGTQGVWPVRDHIANDVLKMSKDKVRVITSDVGGGFGMKGAVYPEYGMVAWASRKLGRPVKWQGERTDAFLTDTMGRDHVTLARLGFDDDGHILAMNVETTANMGAYLFTYAGYIPTDAALKVLPGVYDIKDLYYRVKGVYSHTVPVDAYRGAGRPESIYLIERLMDVAAAELNIDRVELRLKNMITPKSLPFNTAAGEIYDSGDFPKVFDVALKEADWIGINERRKISTQEGKRRGIGFAYYIESTLGDQRENCAISFKEGELLEVFVGTQSTGQGHETAYAQMISERLNYPLSQISVIQGDSDKIASGGGTGGSRSLTAQAWAIRDATEVVIKKGLDIAAEILEVAPEDINYTDDSEFRILGTDRSLSFMEVVSKAKDLGRSLDGDAQIKVKNWTFPNGCHVAEVEVDELTGVVKLLSYSVVDDFGVILNPLLVKGQVHGGVAQGVGQALMEDAVYDASGQLVSGSFMDYTMPRAHDLPSIKFENVEIPCENNPFGIKGCGEAGTVGAAPAVINAIVDALSDLGVRHIDMPATSERVWRTIQGAA